MFDVQYYLLGINVPGKLSTIYECLRVFVLVYKYTLLCIVCLVHVLISITELSDVYCYPIYVMNVFVTNHIC